MSEIGDCTVCFAQRRDRSDNSREPLGREQLANYTTDGSSRPCGHQHAVIAIFAARNSETLYWESVAVRASKSPSNPSAGGGDGRLPASHALARHNGLDSV